MIRKSVLLAALVTLAPAALLAADPAATTPPAGGPHGEGRWLSQLDTNHDGAVSKEEASAAAQARVDKMFANVDANHDGLITQEELRAAAQARRAEMKAKAVARFKAADKNGDGFVTKEEFAAYSGASMGIGVNTGTSALHLALLAADVGPGDDEKKSMKLTANCPDMRPRRGPVHFVTSWTGRDGA